MTYNSTLLNGNVFGAGSDAARYVNPVGSVLVEGTVGLVMQRGLSGDQDGTALTEARLFTVLGLRGEISARAVNAVGNVDTSVKPLYVSCTAAALGDPHIGVKRFLQSSRAAAALPYSIPQVKRALRSSVSASALCTADSANRATLSSSVDAKAVSSSVFKLHIGLRTETPASATSSAVPSTAYVRFMAADCPATAASEVRVTARVLLYGAGCSALAVPVVHMLNRKQLSSVAAASAVASGVVAGKFSLQSYVEARVATSSVMQEGYRPLVGRITCSAITYAAIEERDFKPAPEERLMVVPSEDRKMMVN